MASATTLEIPPVALNGADLFLRKYAGKLRILICGQNIIIFALQDFKQILIGLSCFRIKNHTQISCYERPAFLTGSIPVIKTVKGIAIPVLFLEIPKIVHEILIMLIIVPISSSSRHSRSCAYNNRTRILNMFRQRLYLFFITFVIHRYHF